MRLDHGLPFAVFADGTRLGLHLVPELHGGEGGSVRRLRVVAVEGADDAARALAVARLELGSDGEVVASDEESARLLATPAGVALVATAARLRERLVHRFERLTRRRDDPGVESRPTPEWKPGAMIAHSELWPSDATPVFVADGRLVYVVDQTCIDPACECRDVALDFVADGGSDDDDDHGVVGVLGASRPSGRGTKRVLARWRAVNEDDVLVEQLVERRRLVRDLGPRIVGTHYEARRRTLAPRALPPARQAVPASWLGPVYALAERMAQRQDVHFERLASRFALTINGSAAGDLRILDDGVALSIDALREVTLERAFRDDRDWDERRARIVAELPLVGGTHVPLLETFVLPPEDDSALDDDAPFERDATEEEIAHLVVGGYAFLELYSPRSAEKGVGTFDTRVTIGERSWDVTLTPMGDAADEKDWRDALDDPPGDDEIDDDAIDDDSREDEADAPVPRLSPIDIDDDVPGLDLDVEALCDDALTRGATDAELERLDGCVRDLAAKARRVRAGGPIPWRSARGIEWYLTTHAPRYLVLQGEHGEHLIAAMRSLATWLEHVGHDDGDARATLARIEASFRRRVEEQQGRPRLHESVRASSTKPSRARWAPGPGEALPDDKAPCPCGSGRRFKKCCKLR